MFDGISEIAHRAKDVFDVFYVLIAYAVVQILPQPVTQYQITGITEKPTEKLFSGVTGRLCVGGGG